MTGPDANSALLAIVSILILFFAMALRPSRARCPADMYLDTGIRRDGSFECWSPAPVECAGAMPGRSSDECHARFPEPVHIDSQIYCTGGSQPIVVDDRTVGCQQGGW